MTTIFESDDREHDHDPDAFLALSSADIKAFRLAESMIDIFEAESQHHRIFLVKLARHIAAEVLSVLGPNAEGGEPC